MAKFMFTQVVVVDEVENEEEAWEELAFWVGIDVHELDRTDWSIDDISEDEEI